METKITRERLITFLLETPMFMSLTPMELSEIIHIVKTEKYQAGDIIFKEGDPGDAWYVVYRGAVDVLKEDEGGSKKINHLGPKSCFGEMSVLDGLPRSATISAAEDTEVFKIPRKEFAELLDDKHLVAYKLIQHMAILLAERQRKSTLKLSELLQASEIIEIHDAIKTLVGDSSTRE
jgi:CRP-like cAMP-binding protein